MHSLIHILQNSFAIAQILNTLGYENIKRLHCEGGGGKAIYVEIILSSLSKLWFDFSLGFNIIAFNYIYISNKSGVKKEEEKIIVTCINNNF